MFIEYNLLTIVYKGNGITYFNMIFFCNAYPLLLSSMFNVANIRIIFEKSKELTFF